MANNKPLTYVFVVSFALTLVLPPSVAFADDQRGLFYFEDGVHVVNTGLDNGYSGSEAVGHDDSHFGWSLGSFYVSDFTRRTTVDGRTIFLKNVGDTVTLGFRLDQGIDRLNGDDSLSIADDENGYDEKMGVSQTDFGRGTLIVRKTDYQNHVEEPQIYTDYLQGVEIGALTQIDLLEEGDYEVVLNYETRDDQNVYFGVSVFPHFESYSLEFSFSIRNGNCMVYPFDVETGSELSNASFTENGFYLDLAKSRYLEINVEREVLSDAGTELVSDTRFNRPAKDGEGYTEERVYTIEVSNPATGQSTTKVIYVGTDLLLKSHAVTGRSIEEILGMVDSGASIAEDGTILSRSGVVIASQGESPVVDGAPSFEAGDGSEASEGVAVSSGAWQSALGLALVLAVAAATAFLRKVRAKGGGGE